MKMYRGIRFYSPRDIARLQLIEGRTGKEDSIYVFVLEEIKAGRLKAHNYSVGEVNPHYLVSERELKRYNDRTIPVEVKDAQ